MNALLSIKPEFGEKILKGEKEYEFRRRVFSNPSSVERVIMYASSPVQRIIGFFSFSNIIEGSPEELWRQYRASSGITDRQRFMNYFSPRQTGFAIEIDEVVALQKSIDPNNHLEEFRPPVSFKYVNGEFDFIFQT